MIDLCRVTPQDANFRGEKFLMAILRPELMLIVNGPSVDSQQLFEDNAKGSENGKKHRLKGGKKEKKEATTVVKDADSVTSSSKDKTPGMSHFIQLFATVLSLIK